MFDELEANDTASIAEATKKGATLQDMIAAVQEAGAASRGANTTEQSAGASPSRLTMAKRKWGLAECDDLGERSPKAKLSKAATRRSGGRRGASQPQAVHAEKKAATAHAPAAPAAAKRASRGRPEDTLSDICHRELQNFRLADRASVYFSAKWTVQQRCVRRYIAKAEAAEKVGTAEEKGFATSAKHAFHMIESGMKLYASYRSMSTWNSFQEWDSSWQALMTFLEDKPDLKLDCPCLWNAYYDVMAEKLECDHFPAELSKFKLVERGVIEVTAGAEAYQVRAISDMITARFQKSTIEDLRPALAARIRPFFHDAMLQALERKVISDLRDFFVILCIEPCADQKSCEVLQEQLAKLESGSQEVRDSFVGLLLKFRDNRDHLVQHAKTVLMNYQESAARAEQRQAKAERLLALQQLRKLELQDYEEVQHVSQWQKAQQTAEPMEPDPLKTEMAKMLGSLAANLALGKLELKTS